MRERQRHDHAVAGDAAPALGEVPEQRLQPAVDARELRDRLRGGEAQRALAEAVEQRGGDLRVAREPRRRSGGRARPRVTVESTDHTASTGSRLPIAGGLPRADEVARAEQLGADVVGDDELAGEHAVEHEQADVVGARSRQARDVPRADATAGACGRRARARPRSPAGIASSAPRSGSASRSRTRLGAALSCVHYALPHEFALPAERRITRRLPLRSATTSSGNPTRSTLRW